MNQATDDCPSRAVGVALPAAAWRGVVMGRVKWWCMVRRIPRKASSRRLPGVPRELSRRHGMNPGPNHDNQIIFALPPPGLKPRSPFSPTGQNGFLCIFLGKVGVSLGRNMDLSALFFPPSIRVFA